MTPKQNDSSELERRLQRSCRWEKDPTTLRSVFADLVRVHYSDKNNISSKDIPQLMRYIWTDDPQSSGIYIDTAGQFKPEIVEKRPAIFVDIGDLDFQRISLHEGQVDDLEKGTEKRARSIAVPILFHHVGTTSDEALALARITAAFFMAFSEKLRRELGFYILSVAKLGRASVLYEAKERWVSTVTLQSEFIETWQVALESHKLKVIELSPSFQLP